MMSFFFFKKSQRILFEKGKIEGKGNGKLHIKHILVIFGREM